MRQASIDILRTVAIALMVLVHFLENLAGAAWTPAGFGAPLFAFLAGVSFRIWEQSRQSKGIAEEEITRIAVRRGLFLFGLGLFFNFFMWLPDDLYNWDVLTMIGTALTALAFVRHLPSGLLLFGCAMIYLLAPMLRLQADYDSYWLTGFYDLNKNLQEVLVGYICAGYFPLFPWVLLPVAGYVTGKVLFPEQWNSTDAPPSVKPLILWGAGLFGFSLFLRLFGQYLPDPLPSTVVKGWAMFPASPEYIAGVLGLALLLFGALLVLVDRRRMLDKFPGFLSLTRTMSQYSLTMYLLHHALHIWPLWVCGSIWATNTTDYWRKAMNTELAVALWPVCLVFCYLLFRRMAHRGWYSVESSMRWLCD